MNEHVLTRREVLKRISAGALLAWGVGPAALAANARSRSTSFRFIVVNDLHRLSPECDAWLAGVVQRMKAERPEFCLVAGDLTEHGRAEDLAAVKSLFKKLDAPVYPVIGNHDYLTPTDRRAYVKHFPRRLNYHFSHRGWQFVGLDTTEGQRYERTRIQPATFDWLRDYLPRLDRQRPTVVFTHFPLGAGVNYRPVNAIDLLERLRAFNLQAVFSGHFHGFTERHAGSVVLTTNCCCALKRANHDQTKAKGFFLCTASEAGIAREFIESPGSVHTAVNFRALFNPSPR
jgi:3',5'-cyclic AMP phosphodiesterase CpdA